MKREELFLAAAIAASVVFLAPSANAGRPPASVDARARDAAEKGPEQLRAFIHRTRNIWDLNYEDYYVPGQRVPEADISLTVGDGDGDGGDGDAGDSGDNGHSEPAQEAAEAAAPSPERLREIEELREQIYRDMQRE